MHPSWSPDGRRIAFWGLELEGAGAQRDLWTVPADGSEPEAADAVEVLLDEPLDWNPVWAADGRSLFFSSTRGGTLNLWRIFLDPGTGKPAGGPHPVTVPSSWAGWISVSRDGRRLIFVDRNAQTAIHRAPFDPVRGELAGTPAEVPLGTVEAHEMSRLSPDGRLISFSKAGLPQHLFVAGVDGSGVRQLTDGEFRDRMGTFSPDGKWLAFQTTRCACPIGLIGVDGSALRLVKGDRSQGWYPTWSPDGRRLALSETAGSYLLALAEGDAPSAIEPLPQPEGGLRFWPTTWSSDGRLLAGDLVSTSGSAGIAVLSLADGIYRVLSRESVSNPVFVPGGRWLIWSSEAGLWIQDLNGDAARPLLSIPEGQGIRFPSLSADGRWLAWRQDADESDIWMAELADAGVTSR
jgi:Tol biopolymer transport system component